MEKTVALFLVLVLSLSVSDFSVYAKKNEKVKRMETVSGNENIKNTQKVYEGDNYVITFLLDGCWTGGYDIGVKIQNTSDVKIENWYLDFDYENIISNIWNAEISSFEAGHYVLKNAGYNQDISANGTVEFGFGVNEDFKRFPEECVLLGEQIQSKEDDYSVEYTLNNDWGEGFTGNISITNHSKEVVEDWCLEFDFERNITYIWNGVIQSHEKNHYIIKNADYNANIAPGQTISFGFNGNGGSREQTPFAYQLLEYSANAARKYNVFFEVGEGSISNVPETQILEKNQYATKPDTPVKEGYWFMGWYEDQAYTQYFDFEDTPIKKDITLYAKWLDYTCESDIDNDKMSDALEELLMTDPDSADSDGDGLTDYDEIMFCDTKPYEADTDGDGICDGEEDQDEDTLTNREEIEYGTNPLCADSDSDKLTDLIEIKEYRTNPLRADTDGDWVSDGKELELGTDPLTVQDKFLLTVSSEETGMTKASVEIELAGNQVETLCVEKVNNELLFPDTIPGYMGEAYDFTVDGTFETAILRFEFPKELLDTEGIQPTIYYFNEESQVLEPLETKGFKSVELILLIDDSGSMSNNDPYNQRLSVARDLVDKLPEGSKVGIGIFTNRVTLLPQTLTTDKEEVKAYLTTDYFHANGRTFMYSAISKAMSLYETDDDSVLKMMVVLSDGVSYDKVSHSSTVSLANKNKIRMYTVGLGESTSYFKHYMEPLANNTAGKFYLASDAKELTEIYDDIHEKIDLSIDSDGDGIADYYEDNMVIFNGCKLLLDKNNPDTDGDGVSDGEEIVNLTFEYNENRTKVKVTGRMKSNPTSQDSDGDGLYDYTERYVNGKVVAPMDPEPLLKKNGPDGMWDYHVYQQEHGVVATEYVEEDGMQLDEIIKYIQENIYSECPNGEELAEIIVEQIIKLEEPVEENREIIRVIAIIIRKLCNFAFQTEGGAYILNFVQDTDQVAYHSQPDTWQRYFGYNHFYDLVFDVGSNMHYISYDFALDTEKEYVLWMWKGDYWNLHSGAEIGLYTNPHNPNDDCEEEDVFKHYDVIDFEVPMTLSLYNYYNTEAIDNIFNWAPQEKQWWITGFSGQNQEFMNPAPEKMVVVGSVDLSDNVGMYEALKEASSNYSDMEILFDDARKLVWINWYKGVK